MLFRLIKNKANITGNLFKTTNFFILQYSYALTEEIQRTKRALLVRKRVRKGLKKMPHGFPAQVSGRIILFPGNVSRHAAGYVRNVVRKFAVPDRLYYFLRRGE